MYKPKQIKNSYFLDIKNKFCTFYINFSRKILIKKFITTLSAILFILSIFLSARAEEGNIIESETIEKGYLIFGGRLIEPPYKVVFRVEGLRSAVEVNGITIYEYIEKTEKEKIKEKREKAKHNLRIKYYDLRRNKKYSDEQAKIEIEDEITKEKDIGVISKTNLSSKSSKIEFTEGETLDLELDKPMNSSEFRESMARIYPRWNDEYGEEKAVSLLKKYLEEEKNKNELLEDYKFMGPKDFNLKFKGEDWGLPFYLPWLKGVKGTPKDPNQKELPWYTGTKNQYKDLLPYLGPTTLVIISKKGGKLTGRDPKEKIEALKALGKENLKEEKKKKILKILETSYDESIDEILDNFWEQK